MSTTDTPAKVHYVQVTRWGHPFYKNVSNDKDVLRSQAAAIKECKDTEVVVHSKTKKLGRLWGCMTPATLLKWTDSNRGIYEMITKLPCKMFFDIDNKVDHQHSDEEFRAWVDKTMDEIETFFPRAKEMAAISGSNMENKRSLHITLNNYMIRNENERANMKLLVHHMRKTVGDHFDHAVYTKNRQMKAINQSKDDGRVQEIIVNACKTDHLITCFFHPDSDILPLPELPEVVKEEVLIEKTKTTFNLGTLPPATLVCPENVHLSTITPAEVLALLPNTNLHDFRYRHLVCNFCATNGVAFEKFFAWIVSRHGGAYDNTKVQKWQNHWSNIGKFPPAPLEFLIPILKHYYPHIAKDVTYRNFAQTFELPRECVQKIETITPACFSTDAKYLVFNVGMGGGKTAQTIDYLESTLGFCWIAPNSALINNTYQRFADKDINVCHYGHVKTSAKMNGALNNENKLIICLNSLHYLKDVAHDNSRIVVIDEVETLLTRFEGEFLEGGSKQNKLTIWRTFITMLRSAAKVILLDAFITTKTLNLIKQIENTLDTTVMYERAFEPQTRTVKYMSGEKDMMADILTKLRDGSKLFIFYPFKDGSSRNKSMEQFKNMIEEETGKRGEIYNADVADTVKAGLKNVNKSWADLDFVIVNNSVTCGVNYDRMDFDYVYIFVSGINVPRDIIQVSYRTRHLNSGIIKICYTAGKQSNQNAWINDCAKMQCPIYNHLYRDILIEKKAPLKRAIQLFCTKAHYKQTTDDFHVNEQVAKEIKEALERQNAGMSYDTIRDIDRYDADAIEELCFAQQATMADKYALSKFYFKKSFVADADPVMLRDIWDDKYAFFFKRVASVLANENHLFCQIAAENKYPNVMPCDVKKSKLSDELRERIFKEFSFRCVNMHSATSKILKEIYNAYFGKNVIKTEMDDAKHAKYIVDERMDELVTFAKANLLLDTQTYFTYNDIAGDSDSCVEV